MYKKRTHKEALEFLKDKKPKGHDTNKAMLTFMFNCFILFPCLIFVLLPLSVIFGIYYRFTNKSHAKFLDVTEVAKDMIPQKQRKYDLVMYGATGFTGKLACKYIALQYPKLRWAIAGRSQSKLQAVKKELTGIDPALEKNLDIIIADSFNVEQLTAMVKDTRVVISTVGPFTDYGNYLVALCAQYGTHYCDTTGEFEWTKVMIEKYDDLALKSGANIVSYCAYDSTPFDLMTYFLGKQMQEVHKEKLAKVDIYQEGYFNPSGGTLLSIDRIMKTAPSFKSQLGFNALWKLVGQNKESEYKTKNDMTLFVKFAPLVEKFVSFSSLAITNYHIVARTNCLLNLYSKNFSYSESMEQPSVFAAFNEIFTNLTLFPVIMLPFLQNTIGKFLLPRPGQGPSEEELNKGYLIVNGFGISENKKLLKAQLTYPTDPGYRDTARMLVESGLCLALNADQIKTKGGFQTPASCQGDVLIQRLVDTGCTLELVYK